ncbi:MAG: hypothetical protein CM15mP45_12710 [Deltaproteobacteria bacterium]|nr:MAG: hypothetical protein CM15mP45_12710 [Deltaproteobacteria bacterium]
MVLMSPALLWGQADLTLYTYDSFNSEWGPGPVVFKRFEEECECKLKVVAPGDSGSMLNRAILEKTIRGGSGIGDQQQRTGQVVSIRDLGTLSFPEDGPSS